MAATKASASGGEKAALTIVLVPLGQRVAVLTLTTHAGFGLHWWPLDDTGRLVTADGSRGQFTFVDRDTGVVVVKTSQWPYDEPTDRQCRDLSYLALPAIARAARPA